MHLVCASSIGNDGAIVDQWKQTGISIVIPIGFCLENDLDGWL